MAEIKNVVVAGGGVLGSQIAFQCAYTGHNVTIWLRSEGSIGRWSEHGIVQGSNGAFAPNAPIARERAMVILGRAMGIEPIENPDLTKYADAAQVVSNNLLSQLVSVE